MPADSPRYLLRGPIRNAYLIIDESTKEAAAVDPIEHEKVLKAAQEHDARINFVLTPHHHWDHAGGNEKIMEFVPGTYGGSLGNVNGRRATDKVDNGDKVLIGAEIHIVSHKFKHVIVLNFLP